MAQDDGYPPKLTFNAEDANALDVVRQAFMNRVRTEGESFNQLSSSIDSFFRYLDVPHRRDYTKLSQLLVDVYWEFVSRGVISPGTISGNPSPPFFHLTEHGKRVVEEPDFQPHDPEQFLTELGQAVANPDATVLAYLRESLHCFANATFVASAMMLGIASERVFLLLCDSLHTSLASATEKSAFQSILPRNAMKPKLDWLTQKFQQIQSPNRPTGWPEDVDIKIPGIYNMIRYQRNDVGHPRPVPPTVTRDDAYGYLRIFPSYYATAEKVRDFLRANTV